MQNIDPSIKYITEALAYQDIINKELSKSNGFFNKIDKDKVFDLQLKMSDSYALANDYIKSSIAHQSAVKILFEKNDSSPLHFFDKCDIIQKHIIICNNAKIIISPEINSYVNILMPILKEERKYKKIGDIYSVLGKNYEINEKYTEAIYNYERACDYYEIMQKESILTLKLMNDIGRLCLKIPIYTEAFSVFEKSAKQCLNNNLLTYNAKKHFMNALISLAASTDTKLYLEKIIEYTQLDKSFYGSSEFNIITRLTEALTTNDVNIINEIMSDYIIRQNSEISSALKFIKNIIAINAYMIVAPDV